MSESPTLPATPAVARPRHSAALIVAATLAFVAAALTVGALFPDYWDSAAAFALVDQTGPLAQNVVFAAALMVGGGLLLGKRSAPTGGALLRRRRRHRDAAARRRRGAPRRVERAAGRHRASRS